MDLSAGKRRLTLAVLSPRLEVRILKEAAPEDACQELASCERITAAVGGPLQLPQDGITEEAPIGETLRAGKRTRIRAADADLIRRGIPMRRTPALESAAPAWMRSSLRLGRDLAALGYIDGRESREAPRAVIETCPAACAAALLGRLPFGRETLEGRIQRQLALIRERVALSDPMDALEELTAHHILSGRLALGAVRRAGELDALLAAFTAWRAHSAPDAVAWVGDDADGWVCLPAREMLEKYTK